MKQWKYLLAIVLVLAIPVVNSSATSALAAVVSEPIYIKAKVLPTHTVIINDQGIITEIISNTTEDVTPLVYKNKVLKDHQVTLTPEIHNQYKEHVKPGRGHVGTLYKQESLISLIAESKSDFNSTKKQALNYNNFF